MFNRLREMLLRGLEPKVEALTTEPRLLAGECRASFDDKPIELCLADKRLRLYPECPLGAPSKSSCSWILVDEDRYFTDVAGCIRVAPGERLLLGRDNEACQALFAFSRQVKRRQLEIENSDGLIALRRLDGEAETLVRFIDDPGEISRPRTRRLAALVQLRRLFGGPIALLPPEQALAAVQQVNAILRSEPHRPKDSAGQPGGVIELPGSLSPVIIGDLHAQVDNLLRVLSDGGFFTALCEGRACLVFLGDTIHPEGDQDLEQMDSSLLMLDLIFRLKVAFPERVFYLRGNHESFSAQVAKAGVPQGILFRKRARELRGPDYEAALADFFELLPLVVKAHDFVACHGGPPRRPVSFQDLIDIRMHPQLAQELVWNRVRRPHHIAGYSERNVEAFKRALGVDSSIPLIVGHTPLTSSQTLWLEAGGMRNHHILHGAHPDKAAVFVGVQGGMVPLEYPAEPLLDFTNSLRVDEDAMASQGS